MTDAFDVLRADTSPIDPPTTFARRLRTELITHMEQLVSTPDNATTASNVATGNTVTPYLCVDGAAAAIEFYIAAFGAVEQQRLVGVDGRIGHAELAIGNSRIMLADEYPEAGVLGPLSRGGSATNFTLNVADVDATFAAALALGATELRPVADQFYGHRQGTLVDPFGHQWSIASPIAGFDQATYAANASASGFELQTAADLPDQAAQHDHQLKHYEQGDLYYFTLPTPDLAKAQAFYGAVLGWQFPDPGNGHIGNISAPPGSAFGAAEVTEMYFVVDDIHAAAERVRAAGGVAHDVVHYDSGAAATCTDDQGVRFHLSVPADKYRR